MTVTNRPNRSEKRKKIVKFLDLRRESGDGSSVMPLKKGVGEGGSAAQKRAHGALPDAVRATKKSSTPVASGTTAEKGAADKNKATTNRNLALKGKKRCCAHSHVIL